MEYLAASDAGDGGIDVSLSGFKFFCCFCKIKKPSRKGWFCGEYRPDGSGEPTLVCQVLNFFAVSVKQKNHPVKDGFVENIGVEPMTFWLPAKRSSQLS